VSRKWRNWYRNEVDEEINNNNNNNNPICKAPECQKTSVALKGADSRDVMARFMFHCLLCLAMSYVSKIRIVSQSRLVSAQS